MIHNFIVCVIKATQTCSSIDNPGLGNGTAAGFRMRAWFFGMRHVAILNLMRSIPH
jgi:hypothetical protein